NSGLTSLYKGDPQYMRIHKRLNEFYENKFKETKIKEFMSHMINEIQNKIDPLGEDIQEEIYKRRLKRTTKNGLEKILGIPKVSARMAENVIQIFVDEKLDEDI
ncbi:MAG: hypothetical protein ACOCUI_05380, partial [bacterium]